ncbi:BTB POZ fold protein [Rutstroemia sp. NJR-2017a WRK4]|nr:BTB POZ fold protein [Rutstroemia sp. NJR-2017a WRK4]
MLVQWLYIGRICLSELTPTESITAIIEFVRLADMCEVTGLETQMAKQVKHIMLDNPPPEDDSEGSGRGHPVRKIFATAAVEGYLRRNEFKFLKELHDCPDFAVDLLLEVKETLKTVAIGVRTRVSFQDPLSGDDVPLISENI